MEYYARRFRSAEINRTFYSLLGEETLREWREAAGRDFLFAVKGSRYITHMKKLKDPGEPVERLLKSLEPLGEQLGPILFQLPPNWRFNRERLESFLDMLPDGHRYAMEFRDPTWFDEAAFQALEDRGAAFCVHDMKGSPSPRVVTSDFAYVRLHGTQEKYLGHYSEEALQGWAGQIRDWLEDGLDVFFYFNNDKKAHAPHDAAKLKRILGGQ